MLSWSSNETDAGEIDLALLGDGCASGIGLAHGDELLRFASACAGFDDAELDASRASLRNATSEAFMVDAAAVAANFEMMTRLADGTGARLGDDRIEQQAATVAALGIAELTSRR